MSSTTLVRIERHGDGGHVAELVLDRPEAHERRLDGHGPATSARPAPSSAADASVRAVVVTSTSPKAFCVGADLKERNSFTDADLRRSGRWRARRTAGCWTCRCPALAAVDGFALGGGLEIALSCDLVVAGEDGRRRAAGGVVGVIPGGGGTQLLTRRVGWSRAAGMIFTARRMPAAEAARARGRRRGGRRRARPASRALEIAARSRQLAGRAAPGQAGDAARGRRRPGHRAEVEDGCWRATAFSGDRAEGVAAFAEKRRPAWPGR